MLKNIDNRLLRFSAINLCLSCFFTQMIMYTRACTLHNNPHVALQRGDCINRDVLYDYSSIAACAAAKRAIGTRNGEHDT